MKTTKIIISGGGTGGHIFPAIAIAENLKNKIDGIEILFVGAKGKMEIKKVPQYGYKIKSIWISGFQRKKIFKNILLPLKIIISFIQAYFIIKKFKPNIVIGTGGFASAPILQMAANLKIPTLIQEQNSWPGATNKILAKKVDKICVAYPEAADVFTRIIMNRVNLSSKLKIDKKYLSQKIVLTGNPVRKEIMFFQNNTIEARKYFQLNIDNPTILVIGGSLGALTINNAIFKGVHILLNKNIQIIWQTGANFYKQASETFNNFDNIKVFQFINEIDKAYAAADIIIGRAGAISISEFCCVGKPVILVPSPNVAENHQTKNAEALVKNNAALMIADNEAPQKLVNTIISLIENDILKKQLAENIYKLAKPDATELITNEIFTLINIVK
ncbi:MAG TPA: undecaprenyldiphospho-muramoylpentapeptide beta-N-acetylglucosaminyltransferase [Bacteroidales bacterium]|nr:undecaprenyldiphospho-muramoylpentapeptide beta-N-acetylglucosaminyltransferase [Bacteroidales bacterium]